MYFRYSLKQLFRRPFINALVLLQLIAVMILSSFMAKQLSTYFTATKTLKNIIGSDCYKISISREYSDWFSKKREEINKKYDPITEELSEKFNSGQIDMKTFEKLSDEKITYNKERDYKEAGVDFDAENTEIDLSGIPHIKNVFSINDINVSVSDKVGGESIRYISEDYADNINWKMLSGKWLSDADISDDEVAIVAYNIPGEYVGHTIDLYTEKHIPGKGPEYNKACKGKVVGIIDHRYYADYENLNHLGFNQLDLGELLTAGTDTLYYAVDNEKNRKLMSNGGELSTKMDWVIVRLDEGLSDAQREEFLSKLGEKYLTAVDMKQEYDNTYNLDLKKFKNDIVFLILAFMIALVSIIAVSVLNTSREMKTYAIYCLSGMTAKDCVKINAIYSFIMLVSSFIVSFIIRIIIHIPAYLQELKEIDAAKERMANYGYEIIGDQYERTTSFFKDFNFSYMHLIIIAVLFLTAFICSMLVPYRSLRKMDIIKEIKQRS